MTTIQGLPDHGSEPAFISKPDTADLRAVLLLGVVMVGFGEINKGT
jgi:hypothetical protein